MKQNFLGIYPLEELPKCDKINKFEKYDILISNIRPYLKKIWLSEFDGGCSSDIIILHPNDPQEAKFIYYSLTTDKFINYMMKTSKGTKMPRGDKKAILKYKIYDYDSNYKNSIVNLASALDSKIKFMEKKYNTIISVKKYFIKYLFENLNVEKNNMLTLGNISEINMGFTPSTKNTKFWEGNNKWLSIADLNDKYVYDTSKKISDEAIKNKKIIKKNTLVMSFKLTLGKLAILAENMYSNEAICNFKWNIKIDTEYMYYYLSFIRIEKYGAMAAKGVTLNKEILKTIPVLLPNYETQQKIAFFLKTIDEKIDLIKKEIILNKEFKSSLLSKMFC